MRVYDWKTLFVTTLVAGGSFIYVFVRFDEFVDLIWLGIFAYLIIKAFHVSLFKEAHDNYIKRLALEKRVFHKLFGKFAPIAPYSPFIFIALICLGARELSSEFDWLLVVLLMVNLIYTIWLCIIYQRHIRIEETQEFLMEIKAKQAGHYTQDNSQKKN